MKSRIIGTMLPIALALALTSCARTSTNLQVPAPVDVAALEKTIGDLDAKFPDLVASRDTDAVVNAYSDDAAILIPGMPIAEGRESIRKVWSEFLRMPNLGLSTTNAKVIVSAGGDLGVVTGHYTLKMDTPKGPTEEVGKFVTVYRKVGKDWKIVVDAINSDTPAAP